MILLGILAALLGVVLSAGSRESKAGVQKGSKEFTPSNALIIESWKSMFLMVSQTPIETLELTVKNNKQKRVGRFTLLYPNDRRVIGVGANKDIEAIQATDEVKPVLENGDRLADYRAYTVVLKKAIKAGETRKLSTFDVYFDSFAEFVPKTINLWEHQFVQAKLVIKPATLYQVHSLQFGYLVGSARVRKIFKNDEPMALLKPVTDYQRFRLDTHFVKSKNTTRLIEISHWGNVYVKETLKLQNKGATFEGAYSTIDFNPGFTGNGYNNFTQGTASLPKDAWGMFYRDEIGNISHTRVRRTERSIDVTFLGRFPLLGGWNCSWDISYNVPSRAYLRKSKAHPVYRFQYDLKSLFPDIPSEEYHLKVALPEGAVAKAFRFTGIRPKKVTMVKTYSYLNLFGRPTVYMQFNNFVGNMAPKAKLYIQYSFGQHWLYVSPVYLSSGLLGLFIGYLLLSKLDFSFGVEELEDRQAKASPTTAAEKEITQN